ncbi:MAG: DNA methyltransferase [Solirubrobacteraceae bacterium]
MVPRRALRRAQHTGGSARRHARPLPALRLRKRQPLRRHRAVAPLHRESPLHRDRVRHARLVTDQSRHLRLDDAGGRAPRGSPSIRDALHERREHLEGDPATVHQLASERPRRCRHRAQSAPIHHATVEGPRLRPGLWLGHFLVITYKELRRLEHQALQRIEHLDPSSAQLFTISEIALESFYGIEIDGFAHEVAMLSLLA